MLFDNFFSQPPSSTVPIRQLVETAGADLLAKGPAQAAGAGTVSRFPPPRSNPWIRGGKAFEPTCDAREAFHRSGLNWAIDKVGLRTDDLAPIPGQFAIRRADTGRVLGIVGPDYVPLQNEAAFSFFSDLAHAGQISFESAGSFQNGTITWVQCRLPDLLIRLGDDISETMLFISNGHIGNRALTIAPTSFRIVCQNTLRLAEAEHRAQRRSQPGLEVGWTVRHTRGMTAALADIRDAYARTLKSHAVTTQAYEFLAGKRMTERLKGAFFGRVFAAPAATGPDESERAKSIASNRRERLEAILASSTSTVRGTKGTAFALLNAATEYIDHERATRSADGGDPEESRLMSATFGSGADLKERAWGTIMELVHA